MCFRVPGRLLASALALASATPWATAEPPHADLPLESRWTWPGTLGVRCAVSIGEARLAFAVAGTGADPLRFGLSSPWVELGCLDATGLLREVENPLGFAPGSDVFVERTALRAAQWPDLAASPVLGAAESASQGPKDEEQRPLDLSVLFTPVSDTFAAFARAEKGSAEQLGCFLSLWGERPVRLEATAAISVPGKSPVDDSWLLPAPPYPGGRLLTVAARAAHAPAPGAEQLPPPGMIGRASSFAWTVTLGMSCPERAPPGGFLTATGRGATHAGANRAEMDLLASAATPGYRNPDGRTSASWAAGGIRAEATQPAGSVGARYQIAIERQPAAPAQFVPSREELSFSLQRVLRPAQRARVLLNLRAEKRLTCSAEGAVALSSSGNLAVEMTAGESMFSAQFSCDEEEGFAVGLDCSPVDHLSITARLAGLGFEPRVSAKARLQREVNGSSFTVAFGLEELPVAGTSSLSECLRAELGWKASSE